MSEIKAVPHVEYARMKTHLYRRIGILENRADTAERLLAEIVAVERKDIGHPDPNLATGRECGCIFHRAERLVARSLAEDLALAHATAHDTPADAGTA